MKKLVVLALIVLATQGIYLFVTAKDSVPEKPKACCVSTIKETGKACCSKDEKACCAKSIKETGKACCSKNKNA